MTVLMRYESPEGKAFGHAVMEGTMTLSEGGGGPAERGVGIVVLITLTHHPHPLTERFPVFGHAVMGMEEPFRCPDKPR